MDSRKLFWRWCLALAGALGLLIPNCAYAAVLEWDANTESDLSGYRVYVGEASRSYSTILDVGNQTSREVAALQSGKTYYFAVTAYNIDGLESDFSQEVSYSMPVSNSAPVVVADAYSTSRNQTLTVSANLGVLANDSDANGDALTVFLLSGPSHGTLTLQANGSFSFVPATDFTGSDGFTYQATDGTLTSSVVTVTLTVTASPPPGNQPPVAAADSYEGFRNQTLHVDVPQGVLANDVDPDGDPLSVFLVTPPSSGLLTLQFDGRFTFRPANDFTGIAQFAYRATDGKSTSGVALVTLTILTPPPPPNRAPIAGADSYATTKNKSLKAAAKSGVLTNDTDLDGDALTAVLVTQAGHGNINLSEDGSFTYVPVTNYSGTDTFTYAAADGKGTFSTGQVVIVINEASPVQCGECFFRITEFLTTRNKPLPPGTVVPAEGDCILATARLLEQASRAFRNDSEAGLELLEIGQLLNQQMDERAAEQIDRVSAMYPSRWRDAASNALNVLPAKAAGIDPSSAARTLLKRGKALQRIEQFIAFGTVAPHSFDGRVINATLVGKGIRQQLTVSFIDGVWFTAVPVRQLNVNLGIYRFEQTAWNQATLELSSESGDTLTFQLVFGRKRVTLTGTDIRGWFTTN